MALEEYRRKRDFKKTPEPAGRKGPAKGHSFVIQKHAATRLHYDFRLELDGVLKSWAVPKGPSLDPAEKRLAVHVEDHPLDYGDFEGIIPKGQYGGGTVVLWDRGTWEPVGDDPAATYRKGRLKFRLHGEKLEGGWNLVRMSGDRAGEDKENWLLFKENDETARPGSGEAIVEERPESVATGRTIEEIAADPDRVWQSDRVEKATDPFKAKLAKLAEKTGKKTGKKKTAAAKKKEAPDGSEKVPGARRGRLPSTIEPQLATLVTEVPRGEEWIHEIKYDGYRVLCQVEDGKARLWTRKGKDWTANFRPVAEAAARLPVEAALLDGEVVVIEPDGTTSFQALQNALTEDRDRDLVYFAFDLLHQDGWDLRGAALADRKELLARLLEQPPERTIRFSEHVAGQGEDFFRQACGFALEGVVSKRADRPYRSGRGHDWVKTKCVKRQEFVIVGYTDPEGSRTGFGALLLAVHRDDHPGGKRVYAGKVGTGFNQETLTDLHRRLEKLERKTPAFENPPRGAEARRSHWVAPELVAEVAFSEWTKDGILRHPSFQGLREDKPAAEVVRERPEPSPKTGKPAADKKTKTAKAQPTARRAAAKRASVAKLAAPAPPRKAQAAPAPPRGSSGAKELEVAGVRLTSPDRVLFPGQGITKLDLARYYERIADRILPHLANRPLTLVRCPEGRAKQCFYQKHVTDQFPPTIHRVDVGEDEPYGAVDSVQGLIALVQMGVLEIHVWGAHRDNVEKPDYVVFDLDPDEGLPWERVALGALTVRKRLEDFGLRTFLKTTGGKGLHVALPLARRLGWDEVKAFTKAVAESIVAAEPELYTAKMPKARRQGKVFIDYLRNGRGATSISVYSTRAREGAPVSAPLHWEELADPAVRGNSFTVENLDARLAALRSDPWEGFFEVRQSITAAMKKAVGLG